jgi:hypothetical protein
MKPNVVNGLRLALLSAAMYSLPIGLAYAGSIIFDDTVGTCTGINCSSLRIPGTVTRNGASANYFEVGLFAARNECLRADVISQGADLEMVVRAPNGSIFANDNKAAVTCPLCPRVVVNNTPNQGWYSTTVQSQSGAAVETNFVLLYGRYPLGNPNCGPVIGSEPGPTIEMESVAKESMDDSVSPPHPGHPGAQ